MAIKHKTAYKMAIQALRNQQQLFLYDAATFAIYPNYVVGQKAAKQVDRTNQAIAILVTDMERNC